VVPTSGKAEPKKQPRRGRPLDPVRDQVIIRAALDGLAEVGYDRLSMAEIASRAGVGKGALYRRWSSKAALVIDAMVRGREQVAPLLLPDTGSLVGDLEAMVSQVPDFDEAQRRQVAILVGILGAATHDRALRLALGGMGFAQPRQALLEVLRRARSRGEISPQVDIELLPDIVLGLNLLRIVLGELPDRAHLERILHAVILPLVTADGRR
jgi:AcrR family transcriptional regulator